MASKQSLESTLPKQLPLTFIKEITNDFSTENELCRSTFGTLYKAILPDGTTIAVERFADNSLAAPGKVFETVVTNVMALQHGNLVQLVGFCHEAQGRVVQHNGKYIRVETVESCLCYQYLPNGHLDNHLHANTGSFDWDWETRFKVIKGICKGLHFLHKGLDSPLIHMNLVPTSIWLDDNYMPKIADFGLSILFGQEQTRLYILNIKGKNGYMAPEYLYKGEISTMSDIYSLGMLIIEITTGVKNYSNVQDRSAMRFVHNIRQEWRTYERIIYNYPLLDPNGLKQVKACIAIGLKCVEIDRRKRPSIVDIVDKLNGRRVPIFNDDKPFTHKRDIRSHVKDVREKRDRYKIDGVKHGVTTNVGIETAVNDLMKVLTKGNKVSMEQAKIVSIVGLGGIGKTTLARAIYEKLRPQFNCWAFVSVSRNPDMKKLFKCMLQQVGKKNNANIDEGILDDRLLIYELNEFLQKRRYFIVIDDIQDISVWKMIRCALPANNSGYIIITTSRILDVAKEVGDTYEMRPLCHQNSRTLLHRRIFPIEDEDKYVDDEVIEISEEILQKCGGVPLAIILISGLLASRGNNIEWHKVCDSIDTTAKNSLDEENMQKILSLSYNDLPSHLRTCLLYLSVFPKGYDIDKDRLIWLWIAHGLIQCGKQDESPFELGETYFYELINRSVIQPVYKRWYYDTTECCHVHDMVLDLICNLSDKEKLVSTWDHMHDTFHSKEVQWLSLQNSIGDHATLGATINMQEVRSVVVFPSAVKLLPAKLACFKVLRVLDLQSCCLSQGCSLKYIGNLFQLRYLGLRETGITHLSEEIGKLQFLQTLDVTGNEISSLPSTVVELKHLMRLRIDSWTRSPNGIGSFTSLEELSTLCIQDSTDIIEELGNQTELRVLGIDWCTGWNVNRVEKSLVECLHKLQKMKALSISMVGECNLNAWVAPQHLRRLELTGCWSSTVPALLNNPSLLLELSFLSIEVRKLRQEDLQKLGGLPALSYLDIEVGNQNLGILPRRFDIGARSFPCLVHCTLRGYMGPVVFEQGAMPELARLHLAFPVREARLTREAANINGGFDLGFEKLPRLQDVSFLLQRGGASKGEVEEAEAALRQAIESHPNHPALEIL